MEELKLLGLEISVIEMFLFGSKKDNADIDILIVSDDFYELSLIKRKEIVKKVSPRFDPVCLTNSEYRIFVEENGSLKCLIDSEGQKVTL